MFSLTLFIMRWVWFMARCMLCIGATSTRLYQGALGWQVHGPKSCNHTHTDNDYNQCNSIHSTLGCHIFWTSFLMENQETWWLAIWNLMEILLFWHHNLAKINIALYPLPKCSSPRGWTSEPQDQFSLIQSHWEIRTVNQRKSGKYWSVINGHSIWRLISCQETDHFTEEQKDIYCDFLSSNTFQPLANHRKWAMQTIMYFEKLN